jgi:hypothetical protein
MLIVSTPGPFEERDVLGVAAVLDVADGGAPDIPDLPALLAVQARHGVTVVPG